MYSAKGTFKQVSVMAATQRERAAQNEFRDPVKTVFKTKPCSSYIHS